MVEKGPMAIKEMYEVSIKDELEYIRFIGEENKTLQNIRESHQSEWKIVEMCREIMFNNAKEVNSLLGEIEDDRRKIKELG
jgi:hypothetical protein